MANSAVPSLGTLADAPARLMDRPLMDYFLIELVPILRASAEVATARAERLEGEMVTAGLLPPPPVSKRAEHTTSIATSNTSLVKSAISAAAKGQPEDEEEALRRRLDTIGQHVGTNIVERCGYLIKSCSHSKQSTKTLSRPATDHGHARHHQVRLQGPMGRVLGQTGGQSSHESSRRVRSPGQHVQTNRATLVLGGSH
jgi:hypothetical protein